VQGYKLEAHVPDGETISFLTMPYHRNWSMDADEANGRSRKPQICRRLLAQGRGHRPGVFRNGDLVKDPDAAAKHIRDLPNRP